MLPIYQHQGVVVRHHIRADVADMLACQDEAFAWDEDDLLQFARGRNCICQVCDWNEVVVGYMAYALEQRKIELF